MTYRGTQHRRSTPGGYFHFSEVGGRSRVYGFGHGDYIRLKDDDGNTWHGSAEPLDGATVQYRFQSATGAVLTGISDTGGIVLRDQRGHAWRGFIE